MKILAIVHVFLFCLCGLNITKAECNSTVFESIYSQSTDQNNLENRIEDKIIGLYTYFDDKSQEEFNIRVYKTAKGEYEAILISAKNVFTGSAYQDGKIIAKGFTYDKRSEKWEDGKFYNLAKQKIYNGYMTFKTDDLLKVRAYVILPLLGRSQYWTKVD